MRKDISFSTYLTEMFSICSSPSKLTEIRIGYILNYELTRPVEHV